MSNLCGKVYGVVCPHCGHENFEWEVTDDTYTTGDCDKCDKPIRAIHTENAARNPRSWLGPVLQMRGEQTLSR